VNNMQELEGLIKEGKHVEFVEWFNNFNDRDRIKNGFDWSRNYIKNKEILSLSDQQLVDLSCVFGVLSKKEGLKTTQIRKILDKFNRIEEEGKTKFDKNKLIKLKPILAYTSARNKETKDLIKYLDNSINKVKAGKEGFDDFIKICDFLRGVVAYHKLAGGID